MYNYKKNFADYLEKNNVKFIDHDERVLELRFGGKNLSSIRVLVFFDKENDNSAQFIGTNIFSFTEQTLSDGFAKCNEMNKRYRWVKFYIDDNYELRVSDDAVLDENSSAEECYELTERLVRIVDEAYPIFSHDH